MRHLLTALGVLFACLMIAGAAPAATTFATPSTAVAVMKAARCDDDVLFTGVFPALRLSGVKPACAVRLDLSRATFTGLAYWTDIANLTATGGTWAQLRLDKAVNVSLGGAAFTGQASANQVAFNVNVGTNVSITGSTFDGYSKGVTLARVAGFTIAGNSFTQMESDGINCSASQRGRITGNRVSNFRKVPGGAHPDAAQCWSVAGYPTTADIEISFNIIDAPPAQGIFLGNIPGAPGFDRVWIHHNAIIAGQVNGLALAPSARDSAVNDNILSTAPGSPWQSTIQSGGARRCGNTVAAYRQPDGQLKPGVVDAPCPSVAP